MKFAWGRKFDIVDVIRVLFISRRARVANIYGPMWAHFRVYKRAHLSKKSVFMYIILTSVKWSCDFLKYVMT